MTEKKICKRCKLPVTVNASNYDVFEQMHWLCFHLEYEHEGDPDKACGDPGCPWQHIDILEEKLRQLGVDPDAVIEETITRRWNP